MIPLTKLCQLTGISRRMLQDYDKLGLLTHCAETPGGYWLYEEKDLERLALIQLLRRAGYSRQELLQLLGTKDSPADDLLQRVQASLQERHSQICRLLHCISALLQPPPASGEAPDHSFLSMLEAAPDDISDASPHP